MNDAAYNRSRMVGVLTSPKVTVYCLALLMVLTFWGTLHQVEYGLFDARQKFFDSWYFLIGGFIPFPGTQLVMAVLLVNLGAYMIDMLLNQALKPGIVLIHAGILMMLLGGAVTHHFAEESHVTLAEGEAASSSASYHEWELAIWNQDMGVREVYATDLEGLNAGDVFVFDPPGIKVEVLEIHRNARAFVARDPTGQTNGLNREGISSLESKRPELEPEANIAAGIFNLYAGTGDVAKVILFGEDTAPVTMNAGGREWTVALRHKRFPLPMIIGLKDFRRELHPGTEMARSFASDVVVHSDRIERDVTISMNKPLRHREYTLYQASFGQNSAGEISTFAVMKNYGRLVPYVATSVVVLGMILHFVLMLVKRTTKGARA